MSETDQKPQFKRFVYLGEGARITGISLLVDRATGEKIKAHLGDKFRFHFRWGSDDTDEHLKYVDGIIDMIEPKADFYPTGNITLSPAKLYNKGGGAQSEFKYEPNVHNPELLRVELIARKEQITNKRALREQERSR